MAGHWFVVTEALISDLFDENALGQDSQRISVFFGAVHHDVVIHALFIGTDQRWAADEAFGEKHGEFFAALGVHLPAFRVLDRRKGHIQRRAAAGVFHTVIALHENGAHRIGRHLVVDALQRLAVIQLEIGDDAGHFGIFGRVGLVGHFFCPFAGDDQIFPVHLAAAHADAARRRTVNDMQQRIIAGWRPAGTRPMPDQRFFARLHENIPQRLCPARAAVQIVAHGVQFRIGRVEAGDAMSRRISAGGQRRPHRRRHRRHTAQKHQILSG